MLIDVSIFGEDKKRLFDTESGRQVVRDYTQDERREHQEFIEKMYPVKDRSNGQRPQPL